MERERTIHYFQQLGHSSKLLLLDRHGVYMGPQEMTVTGDKLSCGQAYGQPSTLEKNDNASQKNTTERSIQLSPITVFVNCTCSGSFSSKSAGTDSDGNGDSDSDSDSDSNKLTLDKLLDMLERLQRVPQTSSAAGRNLLRLASSLSVRASDSFTDEQINQITKFLTSDHDTVKDCSLKVVEKLLLSSSWQAIVEKTGILDHIIEMSVHNAYYNKCPQTQALALGVLDKLLTIPVFNYTSFWERLDRTVFPQIVFILHGGAPVQVKHAACCVLRTLARDAHFASRIKADSRFMLQQLRDCGSAQLREVYVGVLMALFTHPGLTEAGGVDIGFLPVIRGLLKNGPCEFQKHALDLLTSAMCDGRGVEAVVEDERVVAFALACLLTSKCRKVRASAAAVTEVLTSIRKKPAARKLMEGISYYVQPQTGVLAAVGGGLVATVSSSTLSKNIQETRLWHNMDYLLDSVAGQIHNEALLHLRCEQLTSNLPLRGQVSPVQLTCLTHLIQVATAMCSFPLHKRCSGHVSKQIDKKDLGHICDDFIFFNKYSSLKHKCTTEQWHRFGVQIFAIFRWLTERIVDHILDLSSGKIFVVTTPEPGISHPGSSSTTPRQVAARPSSSSSARSVDNIVKSPVQVKDILSEAEHELLLSLLHFVLGVSIMTCSHFLDPHAHEATGTAHDTVGCVRKRIKDRPSVAPTMKDKGASGDSKSMSPRAKKPPTGLPKIDSKGEDRGDSTEIEMHRMQALDREAVSERLVMRRGLYNEGLFPILGHLLLLADPEVKKLCCLILRTSIQPFGSEKSGPAGRTDALAPLIRSNTVIGMVSANPDKNRPQSSASAKSSEKHINIALSRMSPASATVMKDALDHHSDSSASITLHRTNSSASSHRPGSSMSSRPASSLAVASRPDTANSTIFQVQRPLVSGKPVSRECQREAVNCCGTDVVQGLFSRARDVKMSCLLFLLDMARYAHVDVLMHLSKFGLIPKLLDFIRVNDQDEQLAVIGLIVAGLLIPSDDRLRQLFSRHGGHTLLMGMTRHPNMYVRAQVCDVFAILKRGNSDKAVKPPTAKQRPCSAPSSRQTASETTVDGQPKDIWDHIMRRWQEEDKVVHVLQKFLK